MKDYGNSLQLHIALTQQIHRLCRQQRHNSLKYFSKWVGITYTLVLTTWVSAIFFGHNSGMDKAKKIILGSSDSPIC
jgi:hypothetical protein